MSPSHVTRKWVREIGETLPNTYGMVVRSITDLDRLYQLYEQGDKSVFAVFSKEKARDGYMRYPAVTWNRRRKGFLCPDCMEPVQMEVSEDAQATGRTLTSSFSRQNTRKITSARTAAVCCGLRSTPAGKSRGSKSASMAGYTGMAPVLTSPAQKTKL